ncbi:MAG: aminodeoxychorismate lyase [Gammaproteobacteria bacterium]
MVLINGQPGDRIDAMDRGLAYGDGLFETVAVLKGEFVLWDQHMRRLLRGCGRLGFSSPDSQLLEHEARALLRDADGDSHVLRITVTRGVGGRGYALPVESFPTRILSLHPWVHVNPEPFVRGVDLMFCDTPVSVNPVLAGLKHLNRLDNVLARQEVVAAGVHEGLMSTTRGHVISGTQTNLFFVERGGLVSPDLGEAGVFGTCAESIIETAARINLPVTVEPVTRERVICADELFLSNSVVGIWPVSRVIDENRSIGPVTRSLQRAVCRPWLHVYSLPSETWGKGDGR